MYKEKELLIIAQRLRALAQNGLVYNEMNYESERYEEIITLSDRISSLLTDCNALEIQNCFKPAKDYVTPKVDVRAVVFNQKEEILMVQEQADGLWSIPGGWADVGYSPSEVARKEVFEETGLVIEPMRLLGIMDKSKHNHPPAPHYVYKIFILCKIKGGNFKHSFDILDKGFFPIHKLPPLSEERILKSQIDILFDLNKHPEKDSFFD